MSKNENIVEKTVYVGLDSSITACLIERAGLVKVVSLTMDNTNGTFRLELGSQELSLLFDALREMKDKQSNSHSYRS